MYRNIITLCNEHILGFFLWDRSSSSAWPQTSYVANNDLKLLILLCPSPRRWDCKCGPPSPMYAILK